MSEEKIRNYKQARIQGSGSESIPSFLLKTYQILENSKYCDVICWTKNGEGFVVKKVKEFAENILPIHFRHSNYTSFVRQLNMYDFHKTRQENQENAFKNSMFKRGQKQLLKEIQRKDYKKKKQKPENYEKMSATINENQSGTANKQDKKVAEAKQLHEKIIVTLKDLLAGFEQKQLQLSQISSNDMNESFCVPQSKEAEDKFCYMVDILYKCKNFNSSAWIKLTQLNKQWQSLLNTRQKNLKQLQNNFQELSSKKQLNNSPTLHTLKSLAGTEKRIE